LDCPFTLIQRLSCNKFLIGNLIAADGLGEVVVEESTVPKRQSETPPPTYEEALYRYFHVQGFDLFLKLKRIFLPFFLFLTVAVYSLSLFLSYVYRFNL
jgi:hypothetical protein